MFKTDKEVDIIIREYNSAHYTNLPTSKIIHEETYKICKEIAKSVLKKFPNFPEETDFHNEDHIPPKYLFTEYCYSNYFENSRISEISEKYEVIQDLFAYDILKVCSTGADQAFVDIWHSHVYYKSQNTLL